MKCPKCDYLGFETGDRCKNCGYDFSLVSEPNMPDLDLAFDMPGDDQPSSDVWFNQLDEALPAADQGPIESAITEPDVMSFDALADAIDGFESPTGPPLVVAAPGPVTPVILEPAVEDLELDDLQFAPQFTEPELVLPPAPPPSPIPVPAPATRMTLHSVPSRAESALPLFTPAEDEEDEPLIKLPVAPRPPLAVRRTPDTPRLRAVPRPLAQPEPALAFVDDEPDDETPVAVATLGETAPVSRVWRGPASNGQPAAAGRRLVAAALDHLILLSIDLAVVYFTLRVAMLDMSDWATLPPLPLALFLLLIKVAYFAAFTAIGGQTIGKMATRIRVVTSDNGELDGAQAVRRTLAGTLSTALLGLGFIPGLVGDRRALHDRIARTRVVGLESA